MEFQDLDIKKLQERVLYLEKLQERVLYLEKELSKREPSVLNKLKFLMPEEDLEIKPNSNDSIKENPKSLLETLTEEQIVKLVYPNSHLTREMLADMTELDDLHYKDPRLDDDLTSINVNNITEEQKVQLSERPDINSFNVVIPGQVVIENTNLNKNGPAILTKPSRKPFQGNPYINKILENNKKK